MIVWHMRLLEIKNLRQLKIKTGVDSVDTARELLKENGVTCNEKKFLMY